MKRPKESALPLPQHDYGLALQTAVSWLGDRHLLAAPVPRRSVGRRELQGTAMLERSAADDRAAQRRDAERVPRLTGKGSF
jgi:hypothetical protein